jgi:hypothetical protein
MKNAIWLLGRKEMVMWLLERRKQNVNVVSGKKTKCQCGFRKEDKMSMPPIPWYSSHKGGYILNESKYYLKVVYVWKEDKMSIWFQERKQNVNTHNNTMSMWFQERRQNVNVVSGKKTKCQCGFRKKTKWFIRLHT